MLLAAGCLGGFGHLLVIKAFYAAPASVIAPWGYAELIGTTTLSYLLFANFPQRIDPGRGGHHHRLGPLHRDA